MIYTKGKDYIKIFSKEEFNPEHILECGQVFCFSKENKIYKVFPQDKYAEIEEKEDYFIIKTQNPDFFENYFDLKNNYQHIKENLSKFEILIEPIKFGYGIRILKQDIFETLISFIISANNNIKRIKLILNNIRHSLGEKIKDDIYSFPTYQKLLTCDENFFKEMGAGYRANYLYKVLRQISPTELQNFQNLTDEKLRTQLVSLSGVGPKVADCIMLFGFHRGEVFPVDTWIEKMYNTYYPPLTNREKIRENLVKEFKTLSGYAQQYLFYYQRSVN